jgi:hypothetical protein
MSISQNSESSSSPVHIPPADIVALLSELELSDVELDASEPSSTDDKPISKEAANRARILRNKRAYRERQKAKRAASPKPTFRPIKPDAATKEALLRDRAALIAWLATPGPRQRTLRDNQSSIIRSRIVLQHFRAKEGRDPRDSEFMALLTEKLAGHWTRNAAYMRLRLLRDLESEGGPWHRCDDVEGSNENVEGSRATGSAERVEGSKSDVEGSAVTGSSEDNREAKYLGKTGNYLGLSQDLPEDVEGSPEDVEGSPEDVEGSKSDFPNIYKYNNYNSIRLDSYSGKSKADPLTKISPERDARSASTLTENSKPAPVLEEFEAFATQMRKIAENPQLSPAEKQRAQSALFEQRDRIRREVASASEAPLHDAELVLQLAGLEV